jgi:hypothetical protein
MPQTYERKLLRHSQSLALNLGLAQNMDYILALHVTVGGGEDM